MRYLIASAVVIHYEEALYLYLCFSGLLLSVCVSADDWEIPFENISDLQWLGSGAQGAVFLGKLKGELVAIKKLRDKRETDIRHLRKLNHPSIISFKCGPCYSLSLITLEMLQCLYICICICVYSSPVSTGMGDCLRAGKLSHYVTSHPGQLSLSSFWGR